MAVSQDELIEAGISQGLIEREVLAKLRVDSRKRRESLLDTITKHGRFPISALYRALAESRGIPFIDLNSVTPLPKLFAKIPAAILRRRPVVPVQETDTEIVIATSEPDDQPTINTISRLLGKPILIGMSDPESLQDLVKHLLSEQSKKNVSNVDVVPEIDPVEALERIMSQAVVRRASDIHLEPITHGLRVRFRIDGRLSTFVAGFHAAAGQGIVSRVKVLAGLDIAEQRAPQDGRFTYSPDGQEDIEIDVRVATVPTRWGERATLRLLGMEAADLTLEKLGMSADDLIDFRKAIRRPHGIILLTGPTGSGKSTTLYASLREINANHVNLMTVEDPIEYVLEGVSQVHVGGSDKVTFASSLRSLLRHDPDVLMVGEIRDHETADVAMKAAMTGHLLFSTLHTNSSCGAVTRLIDIGCEPYLVGSTVAGVIAQRLVRRLCSKCQSERAITEEESLALKLPIETKVPHAVGCAKCLGTGYYGRIGLFEPLWIDSELARLISRGASQTELELYTKGKLKTLRDDGIQKIRSGVTTVEEVLAATVSGV